MSADNFLSKWAGALTSDLKRTHEKIRKDGGFSQFAGLFEGNRRVRAKWVETKFGAAWVLHEDEDELIAKRGKVFLPTGRNSHVLRKLGLRQGVEEAPAWAVLRGSGSAAHTVRVVVFRTGCEFGSDAKEVK